MHKELLSEARYAIHCLLSSNGIVVDERVQSLKFININTQPNVSPWEVFRFFFFQAEDSIRALYVTGVQTCALPISAADFRKLTPIVLMQALDEAGTVVCS